MKTLENFQAYLEKHPRTRQNFTEICRRAGLVPDDVNELLQRELGVSGEEYLLKTVYNGSRNPRA